MSTNVLQNKFVNFYVILVSNGFSDALLIVTCLLMCVCVCLNMFIDPAIAGCVSAFILRSFVLFVSFLSLRDNVR